MANSRLPLWFYSSYEENNREQLEYDLLMNPDLDPEFLKRRIRKYESDRSADNQ